MALDTCHTFLFFVCHVMMLFVIHHNTDAHKNENDIC